jgi:integrase
VLGAKRLRDLRAQDVLDVVRQMQAKKGINLKSGKNAYGVFAELLGDALARGLLGEDPRPPLVDIWPAEAPSPRPRYGAAEVTALTSDPRLDADLRMYNTLSFYTGLPAAEVCQLKFADWQRQLRVPLSPELAATLDSWRKSGFEAVYGRAPTGEDWLVPRRSDPTQPHSEGSAYKAFRRGCVALGIKARSPQAAQNTFASDDPTPSEEPLAPSDRPPPD